MPAREVTALRVLLATIRADDAVVELAGKLGDLEVALERGTDVDARTGLPFE